jgi:hypothetical protein
MNDTIYRLYVNDKYVDYFTGLKRARITANMYLNQGHTVKILEDNLSGSGSLTEVV